MTNPLYTVDMSQIKNIVFDVGRVLIHYDEDHVLTQLLGESPHKNRIKEELLLSEIWQQLDRGTLTNQEAASVLRKRLDHIHNIEEIVHHVLDNFIHHLNLDEASKALFLELERDYPMYILSNFQAGPFETFMDLHPFIKKSTAIVVSANVKMMKPEKEIFTYLLDTYQLLPQETLFIDDMPENIKAAQSMGIHGIVFKSANQVRDELVNLGVSTT